MNDLTKESTVFVFHNRNVTLNVSLSLIERTVCDVVGTIKGKVEPGKGSWSCYIEFNTTDLRD